MMRLGVIRQRDCQGLHRRDFLQVGGAGLLGLTLADAFRADAAPRPGRRQQTAKACILLYLAGGPSQFETFDPKPQAPASIRGPWGVIPTTVPGVRFSELVPMLARQADQFALLRALHHTQSLHHPWPMMTGTMQQTTTYGAAVTFLKRGSAGDLPPYVHLGAKLSVGAGTLGAGFEPLEIRDPTNAQAALEHFTLARDISPHRLEGRAALLKDVDR